MSGSLIAVYVADRYRNGELAWSSCGQITSVLQQWERVAGQDPSTWTPDQAADWVNDLRLRPSSRKSRLTKLRPYMRWLIRNDHLVVDPTMKIARIKVPKGDPRDFDYDEVGRLLAMCPDTRGILIVILMVQIGLRCGDVARIRIEDIDSRRQRLHVRAKGGRGEPTHWDVIPDEAWGLLVKWVRALGRASGPLIESQRDPGLAITPGHISKIVGWWVRDAGLKAFPHDGASAHSLRHTCAQHMLDGGAELRDVQFHLGHATSRSTEIYLRREPPGLRAAANGRFYLAA